MLSKKVRFLFSRPSVQFSPRSGFIVFCCVQTKLVRATRLALNEFETHANKQNTSKTKKTKQAANVVAALVAVAALLCLVPPRGVLAGPGAVSFHPSGLNTDASLDHEAPVRRPCQLF